MMGDDFTRLRHGLRTPVNHIIGYCEMLIEGGDEPRGRGRLAGLNSILARERGAGRTRVCAARQSSGQRRMAPG